MTSEGAFSYLAQDYQLKEVYLWPINADEQGSPQQVRRVIDAVRAHHIPVVFSESTISDKPAKQVAKDRRQIRRAVRGFAVHPRWPGADLYRPAQHHRANHRQRIRSMTHEPFVRPELNVDDVTVTYNNGHTAIHNASFT